MKGYNFAYLDEQTKRMLRRAILKAVAIPGIRSPSQAVKCRCLMAGAPAASRSPPPIIGPARHPESHRPGCRRHHQRRLHPRLLRPHRRRADDHAHRRGDRRSRPATAPRSSHSARTRSWSTRCRSPSRSTGSSPAAPPPRAATRWPNMARCMSNSTKTSPASAALPSPMTIRSWSTSAT